MLLTHGNYRVIFYKYKKNENCNSNSGEIPHETVMFAEKPTGGEGLTLSPVPTPWPHCRTFGLSGGLYHRAEAERKTKTKPSGSVNDLQATQRKHDPPRLRPPRFS